MREERLKWATSLVVSILLIPTSVLLVSGPQNELASTVDTSPAHPRLLFSLWRPAGEHWLPEAQRDFKPQLDSVSVFPSIGWGLMAPTQPDPPFFLAFKNGSLAANHTHLDLNHISVAYGDTMLAVELGSRPYPADYFSARRYSYYELTTAGHNTVLIGNKGQVPGKQGKRVTFMRTDDGWRVHDVRLAAK